MNLSLKFSLKGLLESFLGLIFKENCIVCNCAKESKILCKSCAKLVDILPGFAQQKIDGAGVFSATIYQGVARDLIRKLKFNHKKRIAGVLAGFLTEFYTRAKEHNPQLQKAAESFVVIPIPTHKANIKERGYNNVGLIAKEFAQKNGLSFNGNVLHKIKHTKPQYSVPVNKRGNNVLGAFRVDQKKHNGETIILIDDVVTTGSTLKEVISEFSKHNISSIVCLTVSKK